MNEDKNREIIGVGVFNKNKLKGILVKNDLIITKITLFVVTLKNDGKGYPIEIPRYYFPKNIKKGDVIRLIKDEITTKRNKK